MNERKRGGGGEGGRAVILPCPKQTQSLEVIRLTRFIAPTFAKYAHAYIIL